MFYDSFEELYECSTGILPNFVTKRYKIIWITFQHLTQSLLSHCRYAIPDHFLLTLSAIILRNYSVFEYNFSRILGRLHRYLPNIL